MITGEMGWQERQSALTVLLSFKMEESSGVKELKQHLETGRGKETDSPQSLQRETLPCQYLAFSSVRFTLNFVTPKLSHWFVLKHSKNHYCMGFRGPKVVIKASCPNL